MVNATIDCGLNIETATPSYLRLAVTVGHFGYVIASEAKQSPSLMVNTTVDCGS